MNATRIPPGLSEVGPGPLQWLTDDHCVFTTWVEGLELCEGGEKGCIERGRGVPQWPLMQKGCPGWGDLKAPGCFHTLEV